MKTAQKKNRPEAATSERLVHAPIEVHEDDIVILAQAGESVKWQAVGTFHDPLGRFPAMPIYEMPDETPAAWNAKVERLMRERGMSDNAC